LTLSRTDYETRTTAQEDAMAIELNDMNFTDEVINAGQTVLVDFGAAWCGPCKMLDPIVEELASEYAGRVKVGKIDLDTNPDTAIEFGVRSLPSILFFRDGKVVDRIVGAVPKGEIVRVLNNAMA
jgi:thioredoxin 1